MCVCVCGVCVYFYRLVENVHHLATLYLLLCVFMCIVLFFKVGVFIVGNQKYVEGIKNVMKYKAYK